MSLSRMVLVRLAVAGAALVAFLAATRFGSAAPPTIPRVPGGSKGFETAMYYQDHMQNRYASNSPAAPRTNIVVTKPRQPEVTTAGPASYRPAIVTTVTTARPVYIRGVDGRVRQFTIRPGATIIRQQ